MASCPITSWQIDGEKVEAVTDFIFLGSKITAYSVCSHEIKRLLLLGRKAMTKLDSVLKSRHITLPTQVLIVKAMIFPVVMWVLDYEEGWVPKNWCFWTVVLEKTLESPLDCKEIQPVHPKGKQSWTFVGRTDAEAETPVLWPPDGKSWLIRKDWILGNIEGRRKRKILMMRWLDGIIDPMQLSLSRLPDIVKDKETWRAIVQGVTKSWTGLSYWATTTRK